MLSPFFLVELDVHAKSDLVVDSVNVFKKVSQDQDA